MTLKDLIDNPKLLNETRKEFMDLQADLKHKNSQISAQGTVIFNGLYIDDLRVAAKLIWGKYGKCWLLRDDAASVVGKRFVGTGNSKSLREFGFKERMEVAKGIAAIVTDNKKKQYVDYIRTGDPWGLDSEPM